MLHENEIRDPLQLDGSLDPLLICGITRLS